MASSIGGLLVALEANSAAFSADMGKARRAVDSSSARMNRSLSKVDKAFENMRRRAIRFGVAVGVAFATRGLKRASDQYVLMRDRVKAAAGAGADFEGEFRKVFAISQLTTSALESNVALFQRMTIGAREFGGSNDQILAVTKSVQQLGIIGGASMTAMRAGTTQFAQAMTSSIVRAEEFNSIMENIPEVGLRIARGLGMTVGQLRRAVIDGKVLSEDVFEALLKQTAQIDEDFAGVSATIQRGWDSIGRSVAQAVGRMNEAAGITSGIGGALTRLSRDIDIITGNVTGDAAEMFALLNKVHNLEGKILARQAEIKNRKGSFLEKLLGEDTRKVQELADLIDEVEGIEAQLAILRARARPDTDIGGKKGAGAKAAKNVIADLTTQINRQIAALESRNALFGASEAAIARANAAMRINNKLADKNIKQTDDLAAAFKPYLDALARATQESETLRKTEELRLERQRILERQLEEERREAERRLEDQRRLTERSATAAARAITNGMQSMTAGVNSASDALRNLAARLLEVYLQASLFGPLEASLTGIIGGAIGAAAGGGVSPTGGDIQGTPFAHGGSFEVGGRGGTDANFVPLALTRGERVIVQTPAQQRRGGAGGNTIFQIDARGASLEAVRRLEALVASLHASIEPRAVAAVAESSRRGML